MYVYDEFDRLALQERVAQFRDQTRRFLAGLLSEDEFRPLRLQNGLYVQRHAPMLRIAIPYGLLSSTQLRKLADVARRYDRGFGHFTTRQNFQLNWVELARVPEILDELSAVDMHAIQTSGNCIRNTTTDHLAGVAADEVVDPRVWCELIRQWSTFHPEFAWLPRKFKIAVNGAAEDRAAILVHDIGVQIQREASGAIVMRILAGGGLGRTPIIGHVIREGLPAVELLNYLEAILRVYNRYGRRDNKYRARIKILVKELGPEVFRSRVEDEWRALEGGPGTLTAGEIDRIARHFTAPAYERFADGDVRHRERLVDDRGYSRWVARNVHPHKVPGYAAVTLSLKRAGVAPGDLASDAMEAVADLAERYSFGELRVSHEQNLILADVALRDLYPLWQQAKALGLATPNIGLATDLIACPGGDFCSLANARSLPVAEAILGRFDDFDYLHDIGEIDINISGCMNACGHHHVGNIGVLGVDKHGEEFFQVSIGGSQFNEASLGHVIGPSFAAAEVPAVVERLLAVYVRDRHADERFIDTVRRIGITPFKEHVYAQTHH